MFNKALVIDNVPDAFQPKPLEIDELPGFYVQTDNVRDMNLSFMDEMISKLEKRNVKLLFAGHRGSGKSTELNRLKKKIADKYFIIPFSVRDELDIYNIDYIDLIFLLMEKIFAAGKDASLITNQKLIENIYSWLSDTTEIKMEETAYGMEVAAGVKLGGGLFESILGLYAEVKNRIKLSGKTQTEMRKKIEPKISDLKTYCNMLINEIELALAKEGKSLLIIVEDADKLELAKAKEIFYSHSGILSEINARMIFSIHIFLLNSPYFRSLESKYERVTLPMIKVENVDGAAHEEGKKLLQEIIEKRMDPSLIEEEALELVIKKSGGNIRDIFEIIEYAAMSARHHRESIIKKDKVDYGIDKVKADYNRAIVGIKEEDIEVTTSELYDRLVEIYKENQKTLEMNVPLLVLLNSQAVLEYNGRQWFSIHPIVIDLLKDMKKI